MQARRRSREQLLQVLYQSRVTGEWEASAPLSLHRPDPKEDEEAGEGDTGEERGDRDFVRQVTEALNERREEIDALIEGASRNWRLDRMAVVDLSILRLAAAELLLGTAPSRVIINEAVELAKGFGADNSANFVNGVLDGLLRRLPK